jgi:hypothetical protein
MVSLSLLWLPIVLSAVIVFLASAIMHMVLPYHQSDYKKLPNEDSVLAALRSAGLKRGLYIFPFGTHKEMNTPAMVEKYKTGPVGMMTVRPSGPVKMGGYLGMWFGYCLLVAFFVAYLTGHTVPMGADYLVVFRVAGTAAFMAFGLGTLSNGIWKSQPWGVTIKEVIDGLVYALLVAGTFGWLWPHVAGNKMPVL